MLRIGLWASRSRANGSYAGCNYENKVGPRLESSRFGRRFGSPGPSEGFRSVQYHTDNRRW